MSSFPGTCRSIVTLTLAIAAIGFVQPLRATPDTSACNLRIAWIKYDENRARYDDLAKYIGARLGCTIEPEPVANYDFKHIANLMTRGYDPARRIDIALLTPYTYVKARELNPDIDVVASYNDGKGNSTYKSYLVWKKSNYELDDLLKAMMGDPRKRLVLVNRNSTSGFFWPVDWLLRVKEIDVLFGPISFDLLDEHDKALEKLLKDKNAWAAATYNGAYDVFAKKHATETRAWKVKAIGVPIPQDAFAVRASLDDDLKRRLVEVLVGINKDGDPRGRAWLQKYHDWVTSWVKASDSDYDPVRAVVRFVYPKVRLGLDIKGDAWGMRRTVDELSTGWFGPKDDATLKILRSTVAVSQSGNQFIARLVGNTEGKPDIHESVVAGTPKDLAARVVDRLKDYAPREGYVSEVVRDPSEWPTRGLEVKMGADDGVQKGYAATITRIRLDLSGVPTTNDIPAWVDRVQKDSSFIKPLVMRNNPDGDTMRKLREEVKLDPNDSITYRVSVAPPERTVGTIGVEAVQKELPDKELPESGNLRVRLKFTFTEPGGTPVVIGKDGSFVDVHVNAPARFRDGTTVKTKFLSPGEKGEFLEDVEAPRTEPVIGGLVTVDDTSRSWQVGIHLILFAWVIAGGAIGGGALRAIGAGGPTSGRTLVVDTFIGCLVGSMALLVLLVAPGANKVMSSMNLASGLTCLVIGLVAGFAGISALRWSFGLLLHLPND